MPDGQPPGPFGVGMLPRGHPVGITVAGACWRNPRGTVLPCHAPPLLRARHAGGRREVPHRRLPCGDARRNLAADVDAASPVRPFDGSPGADRASFALCPDHSRPGAGARVRTGAETAMRLLRHHLRHVGKGRVRSAAVVGAGELQHQSADRCASSTKFTETACPGASHCTTSSTGPRARSDARDVTRPASARSTFTRSVVSPSTARRSMTVIWYPTDAPGRSSRTTAPSCERRWRTAVPDRAVQPRCVRLSAAVDLPHRAARGAGASSSSRRCTRQHDQRVPELRDVDGAGELVPRASTGTVVFVLDQMLAENESGASPFFRRVSTPIEYRDVGSPVGGLTTYRAGESSRASKVAIPMAPAVVGFQRKLTVLPRDHDRRSRHRVEQRAATQTAFAASDAPMTRSRFRNAGHYAFSGLCFAVRLQSAVSSRQDRRTARGAGAAV